MIDNVLISVMFALAIGYFMPEMGMPVEMKIPLFIGALIIFCISTSFSSGISISFDLESHKLMSYHVSLPVAIPIVACSYVLGSVFRTLLTAIPVFLVGVCLIGDWSVFSVSYISLMSISFLAALFFALIFLWLALLLDTNSFLNDIWPRFIAPMGSLGCTFFPWKGVASHAPNIAWYLLFNPITYCVEGLRGSLLNSSYYLSVNRCIGMMVLINSVCILLFLHAFYRRLDPVRKKDEV